MHKRYRNAALFGVLCTLTILAGCGDESSEDKGSNDSLIIGAAVALSGVQAPYDEPPLEAMKLAAEKINEDGGMLGRQIEFVERDMRSDPSQAGRAAQAVIEEGADLLVVACDADFGAPAATEGQRAGILSISLCAGSSKFGPQSIGPLAYTTSHAVELEGASMAEWANDQGWGDAFVMRDTSLSYSVDACEGFQESWEGVGGTTSGQEDLSNEDQSIAATITKIKEANPDLVYICSFPPGAASWIRQIRAAGIDQPILSDMAMDGTYWLDAVPDLSDFYYPAAGSKYGDDPDQEVNDFFEQFEARTGEEPETLYALYGKALMDIYAEAVTRADTTEGQAVADELDQFVDVPTIVGGTTYTPEVHIVLDRPMKIMEVQNGTPGYLETWEIQEPPTLD